MASTYEAIASQTLGSDAASVTFSGIAADWTDLIIVASTRMTGAFSATSWGTRFNSDSGSNYSDTTLLGTGSAAQSQRSSNSTYIFSATASAATAPTDDFSSTIIQVMSYANTNVFKTALIANATAANVLHRHVGLWRSTSAITSVTLIQANATQGDFKAGSTFSLFGVKAA